MRVRHRYVVGDIQGCHQPLLELLGACGFDARQDRLWVAGDLINRGPGSLEVLRFLQGLGDRAVCVLGNHDFYFLTVLAGAVTPKAGDTLEALLAAPDRDALADWLRARPLLHVEDGFAMVHAGLLPQWTVEQALELAAEVERALRGPDWKAFLRTLWGGKPVRWRDDLAGWDRLRIIVNAMCRLRFLTPDGAIDLKPKGLPEQAPDRVPWYEVPEARWRSHTIVHGHWSALGFCARPRVISLDSGCVWGGALTAWRLEDAQVFQVGCPQAASFDD